MSEKFKRKYLVNSKFQLSQASVLVLANILIVLLVSALLSWFYLIAWDGSTAYNYNQNIPVYIGVSALIVTVFTLFLSLRRSRSIAGMMKKLQIVLEDAAIGIVPERKLTFRKSDYFQQLTNPLNDCLDLLRSPRKIDSNEITQELTALRDNIGTQDISNTYLQDRIDLLIQKVR